MSINIGTLDIGVSFVGDIGGLHKATSEAQQGIDRFGSSASKAMRQMREDTDGAEDAMSRLRRSFDTVGQGAAGIGRSFASMAGGIAGVLSAGEFIKAADAVTTLNNQLRLATGSTQSAGQAYAALFDIAQRSRISFTELGGTFAAVSRAGQELGISQVRLLSVTESIGNAMTISGGNAESMKAALVQLGQGLASGTLRGEELNSVMEQTPRLAKALADGLGVPIGKLREMGAAGQITAQQVIMALESQADVLRGEVAGAVLTVGQAFTQLQNASIKTVGEFDKASGASKTLAEAISGLSGAVSAVGKSFSENEAAIKTTLGVLAGAGVAAGLLKTGAALSGVATGVGGVAGAVTVLKGVVAGLNPATLALLGIGTVLGAAAGYESYYKGTQEGIKKTIADLEDANKKAANNLATMRLSPEATTVVNKSIADRAAQIDKLKQSIAGLAEAEKQKTFIPSGGSAERELAAANRKVAESYDDLRIRLSGFKGDYSKYQADLKQIQAGMSSGIIGQQEGISMLTELAKKHGDVSRSTKANVDDFTKSAQRGLVLFGDLAANEGGLSKDFAEKWADLASAASKYGKTTEELVAAQAELLKQQPFHKKGLEDEEKALKEQAKATSEAAKAYDAYFDAVEKRTDALQSSIQSENAAVAALGLSKTAIAELEAAKLEEMATSKEREAITWSSMDLSGEMTAKLRAEAKALRDLAAAKVNRATQETAHDEAEKAAEAWRKASEQIEKDITDALMRGFESGKGFAEVLRDTVVNMFKTMVLRPMVSAIVSPIATAATGVVSSAAGGFATSAIGSAVGGTVLGGATLGSVGQYAATGFMNTVAGTGTAAGMTAGAAVGGANGAAMTAGAVAPWLLGGLALASLIKSLDDSGTAHTGGLGSFSEAGGAAAGDAVKGQGLDFNLASKDYTASGEQSAVAMAQAVASMLDSTATTFGQKAGYFAATAFADDTSKDGAWGALMVKLGDQVLLDWQNGTDKWPGREFSDGQAGAKEYAAAVAADVTQIIKDMELPEWARRFADAIPDGASLDQLTAAVAEMNEFPNTLLQQAGTTRDALVQAFTDGLMAGDAAAAGQAVADQLLASIEKSLVGNAAAQVFDIVNAGIVTPMLDAIMAGQVASEAISQQSIDAVVARATSAAQALGTLFADGAFTTAMASLRTTLAAALGSAGAALNYTARYQPSNTAAQAAAEAAAQREAERAAEAAARAAERAAEEAARAAQQYQQALQDAQDYIGGIARSISDFLASLDAQASGMQSYIQTAAWFDTQMVLAHGGDRDALGNITSAASTLIDVIRRESNTAAEANLRISRVRGQLQGLPERLSAEQFIVQGLSSVITTSGTNSSTAISSAVSTASASNAASVVAALTTGFAKWDINGNGLLTSAEFNAGMAGKATDAELTKWFTQLDANGDGALTQLELVAAGQNSITTALQTGFAGIDINNDGLLTSAEFSAGMAGKATDGQLAFWFAQLDANGDGTLSQLEAINANTANQSGAFDPNDPLRSVFQAIQNSTYTSAFYLQDASNKLNVIQHYQIATADRLYDVMAGTQSFMVRSASGFSGGGYANGGAFIGGVQAFASGGAFTNGIFNRPTMAPMALFGEAGPEAIMPLTRGADGKLGVVAQVPMPDWSQYGRGDSGTAAVVAELQALRASNEALREENQAQARAIVQINQRMTKVLERWDGTGIPEQRVIA